MNFLNPFFLLGMLAVTIPVVIHLINLRRPLRLPFSTLTFFETLQKSTIRRMRIKQYLLLALRIAAVAVLALALARPLLTSSLGSVTDSTEPRAIAVVLDNSPSMNRIGAGGPFYEQAREVARRVIEGARAEDRFMVTSTNTTTPATRLVSSSRALELLDEIEVANTGNLLAESIPIIVNRIENSTLQNAIIYLITDGQKSQVNPLVELEGNEMESTRPVGLQVIRVGSSSQPNMSVSNLNLQNSILSRENPLVMEVEVTNFGNAEAVNQFVSLEVQGRMQGQYRVDLPPGESRQVLFEIVPGQAGDISGRVVIEGDEITFDNERHFVINIPENRSVLLVSEDRETASGFASYLQPAFEAASRSNTQIEFSRSSPSEVDQSGWLQNDVIILDGLTEVPEYWHEELQRYVQEGGGILFFPSEQGDIQNYNRFLTLFNAGRISGMRGEYASFNPVGRLGQLVGGHPILDGIFLREEDEEIEADLPELFFYYLFERVSDTGSYTILSSSLDEELLVEQRFGDGRILVSLLGADPGWSNFPVNALFAPLYYRSVLYASASEQGGLIEYELGEPFVWASDIESQTIEMQLAGVTYRPEVQRTAGGVTLRYSGNGWEPGILHIKTGEEERLVAVNQHLGESDFQTFSEEELETYVDNSVTITEILDAEELSEEDLANRLQSAGVGREIWNWLIWIALGLLIAETIVSKLYSTRLTDE